MSSNAPLHITRTNYEEYFLLYTDNELSASDRSAVEAFILLHPDLREELELLQDTKLDIPAITFGDTSALSAAHMDAASYDESLLLYIDNELGAADKAAFEKAMSVNAPLRAEYAALREAKLDPSDRVIYPNKKELYRQEHKERPALWLRIAAAVILIAGAANYLQQGDDATNDNGIAGPVAGTTPATITKPAAIPAPKAENLYEQVQVTNTMGRTEESVTKSKTTPAKKTKPAEPQTSNPYTEPVADPVEAIVTTQRNTGLDQYVSPGNTKPSIVNINSSPVTSVTPAAYTTTEAIAEVPGEASARKGSVRGMLRKATRFIERRTGINPVDEDDRLLIGAMSISLK